MNIRGLLRTITLISAMLFLPVTASAQSSGNSDPENTLYMDLVYGRVVIEMMPDVAPNHVKRIKELVREGFYDGLKFHRVIDGFMAQTGDPKGDGTGGSGKKIKAEFSNVPHDRGIVSMARSSAPHSASSQFFIVFRSSPHLNGKYSVWGRVTAGMEFVDMIKKGAGRSGKVRNPDIMIQLRVAADVR